jgi:DnaJ-domain-containing protein 1
MARQHLTANGLVDFTAEEEAEWDAQEAEWAAGADDRMAAEHRSTRNNLLAETDWMANSDVTMSDEMRTYRQALRDLPTHSNWPNLEDSDWPTKP